MDFIFAFSYAKHPLAFDCKIPQIYLLQVLQSFMNHNFPTTPAQSLQKGSETHPYKPIMALPEDLCFSRAWSFQLKG